MKRLTEQQKRIVNRIRTLHRAKVPLNLSAVRRHHPDLLQQVMSLKHFRGWRKAIEAAGLTYDELHTELLDHCVCALCGEELLVLNGHLLAKHGLNEEQYCRKYPNETTMADKMRAAKTGALRRAPHWERLWSREYLIDYLIYKHERGEDLSPWTLYRREPAVHANAKKYFGSYRAAIEAAGIDYRKVRVIDLTEKWTPAKVLERIQNLHQQKPLTSTGDIRRRDSRLYDRCHHYFGGVVPAIEAAGIAYVRLSARRSRRWTKPAILEMIQSLDADGSSLRESDLAKDLNGQADSLLAAAVESFGSWEKAIRAAGIEVPRGLRKRA
jgi:hypothetical protein